MTTEHQQDFIVTGLNDQDRQTIETFYQSFSAGQADLLDEAVTEDWQDIPLAPGQEPGREGMKPTIAAFLMAFPDLKVTVHEIIGAPGRAAVRATITGTHRGEWFGVAPTHRAFSMPIHEFHYLENGRLTHTWHLEDWLGWFAQLGAWPIQTSDRAEAAQ